MKIIVGIGNPGKDYENTRHNLGFLIVDEIASELNLEFKKNRFGGQYCRGEGVVLVKPQNYVNNSGECVASFMNFYRSRIDEILIIYDDISLPLSKTRYSVGGAGNGHNGIKSISRCLGGKKFPQLRVGISHDKRYLLADWVLGNFTLEEKKVIATKKNSIIQGVLKWIKGSSFEKLMNDFNN